MAIRHTTSTATTGFLAAYSPRQRIVGGVAALVLLGAGVYIVVMLAGMFGGGGSVTMEPDPAHVAAMAPILSDIKALEAMSLEDLKAEVAKRQAARVTARSSPDPSASSQAEDAYARAREALVAKVSASGQPYSEGH